MGVSPTPSVPLGGSVAESVVKDYEARAREHRSVRDAHARTARRIGWARVSLFAALILGAPALLTTAGRAGLLAAEGLGVLAFAALAVWHGGEKEGVWLAGARARGCTAGIARVERNWNALPTLTWPDQSAAFPMDAPTLQAIELHIVGTRSLVRLLPTVSPSPGRQTLLDWLMADRPPPPAELLRRQAIVRALVPLVDWRERMSILANRLRGGDNALTGFARWAESADFTADTSSG
ncbi:MAG TPA: hypothetical protein VHV78_13910, partial [Gemmatimonadaceae bacterium]|nr:hypothetical protein [Gemmatimonadaceae bacterium]